MRKLGDSISCIKTDKITDDDGMYIVHDIVEVKSILPLNLQQQLLQVSSFNSIVIVFVNMDLIIKIYENGRNFLGKKSNQIRCYNFI